MVENEIPILHLSRRLLAPPLLPSCAGIALRNYAGPADIDAWLQLRKAAFMEERPAVGRWAAADFEREFLHKPWWRPERMWFAIDAIRGLAAGSITLATRVVQPANVPVIHWLIVEPAYRRRGIARLLMAAAEAAAWQDGCREVHLETHAGWSAAVALYHRSGYRPEMGRGTTQTKTAADVGDPPWRDADARRSEKN